MIVRRCDNGIHDGVIGALHLVYRRSYDYRPDSYDVGLVLGLVTCLESDGADVSVSTRPARNLFRLTGPNNSDGSVNRPSRYSKYVPPRLSATRRTTALLPVPGGPTISRCSCATAPRTISSANWSRSTRLRVAARIASRRRSAASLTDRCMICTSDKKYL